MTTIIAISDTHLREQPLSGDMYLPQDTINLIENAQLVLHAGDFDFQIAYDFLSDLCADCQCELWAIQGNPPNYQVPAIENSTGENLHMEMIDERFGLKIGLKHDANGSYNFSESYALDIAENMQSEDGKIKGADLMVFGHIHEPIISWNKDNKRMRRLLVCPGYGTIYGGGTAINAPPHPLPPKSMSIMEKFPVCKSYLLTNESGERDDDDTCAIRYLSRRRASSLDDNKPGRRS